jgi:hypothetical protein
LKIESEWLLNMLIKDTNGNVLKIELAELWFLSVAKKWCVCYNFLKIAAIANENPVLIKKLNLDQVEYLYYYSGVRIQKE